MSFKVYFLQSLRSNKIYVGQSVNVQERLLAHNGGKVGSTRSGRPWKLIYQEQYTTRYLAMCREKYLKSLYGYKTRLKIIKSVLKK